MSEQQITKEIKTLFDSLRMDSRDKNSAIELNSLLTLLQYHKIDVEMPQYYQYLCRKLTAVGKEGVKEEDFINILTNPEVDLTQASKQEMAEFFSILDTDKEGSISMAKYIKLLQSSNFFQSMTPQNKKDSTEQITSAFYSVSQDKRITPIDFYTIIKNKIN